LGADAPRAQTEYIATIQPTAPVYGAVAVASGEDVLIHRSAFIDTHTGTAVCTAGRKRMVKDVHIAQNGYIYNDRSR
jgi:hypothetical protein